MKNWRNFRDAEVDGIAEVVYLLGPTANPVFWEVTAEIVVIVVLFATGLRIDNLGDLRLWRPTIGLLAVTMPLTIAAVALLGWPSPA